MNQNTNIEDCLEALGTVMRSRPRLTDRVMSEVRQLVADAQARPARAPRFSRRRWLAGLAAAAAVAAACWLLWQPGAGWAKMQSAVQSKPWVHLTCKDLPADSHGRLEMWLSHPRSVYAIHAHGLDGGMIRYTDLRLGIRTQYDPASKQLIRLPVGDDADAIQSVMTLLNSIFRGEEPRGERFGDQRIVGRKQRSVEEDGRKWLEYELTLERGQKPITSTLTIRVDPETNLPATMKIAQAQHERSGLFAFDYPADGPADIYALGVPRDTPLDDRMPKDDLKRILSALSVGNRELDNYFAAIGRDGRVEVLAWRRGNKWRLARCTPPPDPDEIPKDEAQLGAWWRKHLEKVPPVPTFVCDSQRVYSCKTESQPDGSKKETWSVESTLGPDTDAGHNAGNRNLAGIDRPLIELAAYPNLDPGPRAKLSLDPTGAGGPAGSVLLELSGGGYIAGTSDEFRFRNRRWLDPQHGYAVVKLEPFRRWWEEFDEFRQSPRGIWYPTRAVRTNANGRMETRYFLDFSAQLPDELFKPQ